jgi:hypothetical protein
MEHKRGYCVLCQTEMVICGKCGNNCCNGGYGTLEDGSQCNDCPSAYQLMFNIMDIKAI